MAPNPCVERLLIPTSVNTNVCLQWGIWRLFSQIWVEVMGRLRRYIINRYFINAATCLNTRGDHQIGANNLLHMRIDFKNKLHKILRLYSDTISGSRMNQKQRYSHYSEVQRAMKYEILRLKVIVSAAVIPFRYIKIILRT